MYYWWEKKIKDRCFIWISTRGISRSDARTCERKIISWAYLQNAQNFRHVFFSELPLQVLTIHQPQRLLTILCSTLSESCFWETKAKAVRKWMVPARLWFFEWPFWPTRRRLSDSDDNIRRLTDVCGHIYKKKYFRFFFVFLNDLFWPTRRRLSDGYDNIRRLTDMCGHIYKKKYIFVIFGRFKIKNPRAVGFWIKM